MNPHRTLEPQTKVQKQNDIVEKSFDSQFSSLSDRISKIQKTSDLEDHLFEDFAVNIPARKK